MASKLLEVSENTAALIEKTAAETKMTKQEVIERLLALQLSPQERPARQKIDEIRAMRGGNGGKDKDFVDKLIDLKAIDKISGGDSGGILDKDMIKSMMQMQMLQRMMPAPEPPRGSDNELLKVLLPILLTNNNNGGNKNDALEAVLAHIQAQDETRRREDENRMKDLERLLNTKEKEQMEEKIERLREEAEQKENVQAQVLDARMNALQDAIMNLGKGEDPISKQIELKLKQKLTTALTDAVSDFDITSRKQQIATPDGKINTQEIIKQTFDTIGKGLDAWKSRGPPQQVYEMPVPGAPMPGVGDSVRIMPQAAPVDVPAPEAPLPEAAPVDFGPQPAPEPATQVEASVPVDRLAEKREKKLARLKGEE